MAEINANLLEISIDQEIIVYIELRCQNKPVLDRIVYIRIKVRTRAPRTLMIIYMIYCKGYILKKKGCNSVSSFGVVECAHANYLIGHVLNS
jgi:hypothetical protein